MAATPPQPTVPDPQPSPSKWYQQPINQIRGAIIAGILVIIGAVASGIAGDTKDWVTDRMFRSPATIEGHVLRASTPVANAHVVLDERDPEITNSEGHFLVDKVSRGKHKLSVEENGVLAYFRSFSVTKEHDGKTVVLTPIALDVVEPDPGPTPTSTLTPTQTPTNGQGSAPTPTPSPSPTPDRPTPVATESVDAPVALVYDNQLIPATPVISLTPVTNSYAVSVWVETTPELLSEIASVTYYLHPTFQPSVVTRYSTEDAFMLSFTTWGEFQIEAQLNYHDGRTLVITTYLELGRS